MADPARRPLVNVSGSRLLLIVSAVLFILAGLAALGIVHLAIEALALFAFACWVGSGAV